MAGSWSPTPGAGAARAATGVRTTSSSPAPSVPPTRGARPSPRPSDTPEVSVHLAKPKTTNHLEVERRTARRLPSAWRKAVVALSRFVRTRAVPTLPLAVPSGPLGIVIKSGAPAPKPARFWAYMWAADEETAADH